MRFAYADPPYPGQARRHYGAQPDYAGEIDSQTLIATLSTFDAWALSTSIKALPLVLPLCSADVLVLAWVKPIAPPMGDRRIYSWEPVILCGGRCPDIPTRLHLVASPPVFYGTRPEHIIGEKPVAFARWIFQVAGLQPTDEFCDLFPGSGAISQEWQRWCAQGALL